MRLVAFLLRIVKLEKNPKLQIREIDSSKSYSTDRSISDKVLLAG